MKQITVFGFGRVGRLIANELGRNEDLSVLAIDIREPVTPPGDGVRFEIADLSVQSEVERLAKKTDVAVSAVPGYMGYDTVETILGTGTDLVDISFMDNDPFELDQLAHDNGALAVVDFGVAPGLSNILLAHGASLLDLPLEASIMVGGLPLNRKQPWEYTAPFSPVDVLEEYTRPARLVVGGRETVVEPLSDIELIHLPDRPELEAFTTDGLRTLIHTMDIPDMVEKTIRYPGYAEKIKLLKGSGLFSTSPVEIRGSEVVPFELTSKLLMDAWDAKGGDAEMTVMRVEIAGLKNGIRTRHVFDLYDETHETDGYTSMARTTGYPAVIAARLLASGELTGQGVLAPEELGLDPVFTDRLLAELAACGIPIDHNTRQN